jgi:hypothetical protein
MVTLGEPRPIPRPHRSGIWRRWSIFFHVDRLSVHGARRRWPHEFADQERFAAQPPKPADSKPRGSRSAISR